MASLHTYTTKEGARRYLIRFREGDRQRGRSFHRQKDARTFKVDIERRHQLGELWQDEGGSVAEFLDGWLARYALRVRASSAARRRHALRALPAGIKARPLARLSGAEVEDAVTVIAHRAPRQAELALASLKLALKDAVKRGLKFDRRILEITSPRAHPRPARFLTWAEVQTVAEWLPDRHARLVMVAALTGLRRGEMVALKWADVDLEAATLTVRAGKTEAARRAVDMPATAVELLREQAEALGEGVASGRGSSVVEHSQDKREIVGSNPAPGDGRKTRSVAPSPSAPVFPNNRGGHLNGPNFYRRWWLPAVRATGQEGITFHALRHSFISMMAASGAHPSLIAMQAGHADGGALVLRRYRHMFPMEGKAAAARFDDYIRREE